jgi:hypothetical protein
MSRKIDNKTYLNYLLQSLNVDELKQLCREYELKGFSKLTKINLIEFILDSLAEEEMIELLKNKELEIISNSINLAIEKINGNDRESIDSIKIVNPNTHEIEILFKGFNWETKSFLSISDKNMDDPERDCDCRIGSSMGFCSHFWVGFIYSLKQDYFKLTDWNLTILPLDLEKKIKFIKITPTPSGESSEAALIDESSDNAQFIKYLRSRITVYDAEISEILEKQSEFQGNITTYYLITLRNVKFGPQIKKASDYKEEDLVYVDILKIRISDKAYSENNIKVGDKITCHGGLEKDNFLGIMLKRVTKLNIK